MIKRGLSRSYVWDLDLSYSPSSFISSQNFRCNLTHPTPGDKCLHKQIHSSTHAQILPVMLARKVWFSCHIIKHPAFSHAFLVTFLLSSSRPALSCKSHLI